jgi:hypothetical protein
VKELTPIRYDTHTKASLTDYYGEKTIFCIWRDWQSYYAYSGKNRHSKNSGTTRAFGSTTSNMEVIVEQNVMNMTNM